jgi:L-ribulose-5-phosphate 3-epimerase
MNPIGIMQGRLSPPADGRIQSFPVDTWRSEFELAKEADLFCIEWIYESGTDAQNPLRTDSGVAEILEVAEASGVAVRSVCADYYMTEKLIETNGHANSNSVQHLEWLIGRAGEVGVHYIVLPFVDSSSLKSDLELKGLARALKSLGGVAQAAALELHLETDLLPSRLLELLESVNSSAVRANYDIGNSASLGRDPFEELTALRSWLGSVHVKDRIKGGHTVPLGQGNADFDACFRLIAEAQFRGPFILQAARQPGLSEVELAKQNRKFVESHLRSVRS